MFYKNLCGINLNLIRAALFIGTYDIFGTLTLIILNYEFFAPCERKFLSAIIYLQNVMGKLVENFFNKVVGEFW